MALFIFKCPSCGTVKKKLRAEQGVLTCSCGIAMERDLKAATSDIKEVLDNGAMSRKVERLANINDIVKKRSEQKKDPGVV